MQFFDIGCILSKFRVVRVFNGISCVCFFGNIDNYITDYEFITLANKHVDRICFDYFHNRVDVYLVSDVKNIK